jgi:hypothetical protein
VTSEDYKSKQVVKEEEQVQRMRSLNESQEDVMSAIVDLNSNVMRDF